MNLVFSLLVGVLFGTGAYMMLRRDLMRVVVGTNLISTAVIVLIIGFSLFLGRTPVYPLDSTANLAVSDPLVQALALTAIVINYGVTTLVLTLIYRIYQTQKTLDQHALHENEEHASRALQQRQKEGSQGAAQADDGQEKQNAGTPQGGE